MTISNKLKVFFERQLRKCKDKSQSKTKLLLSTYLTKGYIHPKYKKNSSNSIIKKTLKLKKRNFIQQIALERLGIYKKKMNIFLHTIHP